MAHKHKDPITHGFWNLSGVALVQGHAAVLLLKLSRRVGSFSAWAAMESHQHVGMVWQCCDTGRGLEPSQGETTQTTR